MEELWESRHWFDKTSGSNLLIFVSQVECLERDCFKAWPPPAKNPAYKRLALRDSRQFGGEKNGC